MDTTVHKHTNALIDETSPYLLQHAHNPVNWVPWSDEAFERAKAENKLVIISIGYSSCHWCHVMERESFEQEDVAALMNEHFINIKVDREERPDVDQVYMDAVQLMTNGRGGWPLNCITLPDGQPVYGGTYFEKKQWLQILTDLQFNYEKSPQKLEEYAAKVTAGVQQSELITLSTTGTKFNRDEINEMVKNWEKTLDYAEGGSQQTQKFPLPNSYDFLMQYAFQTGDEKIMQQVDLTLEKMALGGIYDQIGGGFSRYSTDENWKVPHFEKMLYDNAQLVSLYAKAYQRTQSATYKKVVYQTIEWLKREMMTKEGSFYSALDADSEGEEGKFYIWTKDELSTILGEDYSFVEKYYNVNKKGLWEGNYILLRQVTNDKFAADSDLSIEALTKKVDKINKLLLTERNKRIKPGLDDKSLTSWNALMTIGLLDAYAAFNDEKFLQMAIKNGKWIIEKQMKKDGHLFHTYKEGKSTIPGFLEDYAFTIAAFTKLYENTFDESYLEKADQLTAFAKLHFFDDQSGMFYFTSDEGSLIARKMEIYDNVIPSSNSVMANEMYKLGIILDRKEYKEVAKQMLANVIQEFPKYGSSVSNWGILALNLTGIYYEVAITGDRSNTLTKSLQKHYIPNKIVLGATDKSDLALLEGKFLGEPMIFVCIEGACKLPSNSLKGALKQLKN
ncbi:thioredoxin domain-containing protein [Crocinitomix catalasitica]|uniref:thioredoxin domain-containing protein n=1 Tax=Crocinitomix catalasitica TaxID=184607 RepID=UPI00047F306D|nr:thioredoxin domain-containing protein [Crocinitomix catalasitica]